MLTFREFLKSRSHPNLFLPLAEDRERLVDDVDSAAVGGIWGCSLSRGRGATTLAIACAAWLQIEGVAARPLAISYSQEAADCFADSLRRNWLDGEEPLVMCRGLFTSRSGVRSDFLIIDSPADLLHRSPVEAARASQAIGEWLRVFGPAGSPRAILTNC